MATSKRFKPKTKAYYDGYMLQDKVVLRKKIEGIIHYIGKVKGSKGIWFGIEITNTQMGKHNGTKDDIEYFRCRSHKGIFVTRKNILRKKTDTISCKSKSNTKSNLSKKKKQISSTKNIKSKSHKRTESTPSNDTKSKNKLKKKKKTGHNKKTSVPNMKSINGITELDTNHIKSETNHSKPMDLSEIIHTKIDEKYPMENDITQTNEINIQSELQQQKHVQQIDNKPIENNDNIIEKETENEVNIARELEEQSDGIENGNIIIENESENTSSDIFDGKHDGTDEMVNNNSLVNENVNSVEIPSDLSDIEPNIDVATHINININNNITTEEQKEEVIHPLILTDSDDGIKDKQMDNNEVNKPPEMEWDNNDNKMDLNDEIDSKKEKEIIVKNEETETRTESESETINKKTNGIVKKELHTYKTGKKSVYIKKVKRKRSASLLDRINKFDHKNENKIIVKSKRKKVGKLKKKKLSDTMNAISALDKKNINGKKEKIKVKKLKSKKKIEGINKGNKEVKKVRVVRTVSNASSESSAVISDLSGAESDENKNEIESERKSEEINEKLDGNVGKKIKGKKKKKLDSNGKVKSIKKKKGMNSKKSSTSASENESVNSIDYDGDNSDGMVKKSNGKLNVKESIEMEMDKNECDNEIRIHPFMEMKGNDKICLLCNENVESCLGCCFIRCVDPNGTLDKIKEIYASKTYV